jgi:methylenetetrahydrofolate reductase (NADPH)
LCLSLKKEGVDRFHFYTLNRAELTLATCRRLGITVPVTESVAA